MACLLVSTACSSDGDGTAAESATTTAVEQASVEPTTAVLPETTPTAAAATTAATDDASTGQPSDGVLVPFHFVDASFPAGWTCDDAIPGFEVAFTDERGERTIVAARFAGSSGPSTDDANATCAIEPFDGEPALIVTARLDAPAAETYRSIETRYPFANGVGNDTYDTVFEMVTSDQAQAGLYVEQQQGVPPAPLDPSDVADLNFPLAE